MKDNLGLLIEEYLMSLGMSFSFAEIISVVIILIFISVIGFLADFLTRKILLGLLQKVIRRTKTLWDDILLEKKLFNRIAHFAPALIVYNTIEFAFPNIAILTMLIEKACIVFMLIVSIRVVSSFLNGVNEIYDRTTGKSKGTSIKSYIQVLNIFTYFLFGVGILAVLFNKDPHVFIGGMGAFAAVLMLVFKDSILGLVAGIQISANDMVRKGEWISMPSHNADGTVIDITLNTVKIQNWDKTIATVPTYALVSQSFNNWRGMEESGGRRIKRSISLDMNTIHFSSEQEIQEMRQIKGVSEIIDTMIANDERVTNSGVFREYLKAYLQKRNDIHDDMTFLVRHLQPNPKGLPIEFYVFSNKQDWADYEGVQADIMDHVLAILPAFHLRVFHEAAGRDFSALKN